MMRSPVVPAILQYCLTNFYISFTNIMACTIFRGISLEMLEDQPASLMDSARMASALRLHSASLPAAYRAAHLDPELDFG